MCDFLGFVSTHNADNTFVRALREGTYRAETAKIAIVHQRKNRCVGFAYVKSSVISSNDTAFPPFESACGNYSLVLNGRLYNCFELKRDLSLIGYRFTTELQAEVLLAAWREWGVKSLRKLIGMFAFVVLDRKRNTITFVRDAFGIKPLFYSVDGAVLTFGSDIRSVLRLRDEPAEPNLQRAYDYLVHGDYDSSEHSFVEGIKHLMPGHWFECELTADVSAKPTAWWRPNLTHTSDLCFEQAAQRTRELFFESMAYHLRSDMPVGAAVSGGVDSSAVVCAMRMLDPEPQLNVFSYISGDENFSEEYWVDGINKYVKARAHKVSATAKEMQKDLDTMLLMQGEPFGSTSIYAQYRVFKLANENAIAVTLDGQGADELLAGYSGYPGQRLLSLLEQGKPLAAHKFAKQWAKWPGRSYRIAWMYLARIILPDSWYQFARKRLGRDFYPPWLDVELLRRREVRFSEQREVRSKLNRGKRVREALASSLQGRGLPALLRHGDRNSKAFSVESRVPFLTLPLVEFLLSLPEDYLISDAGETKRVFREAMREVVPDSHLDRKDKIGFATPESEWLLGMADEITRWIQLSPDIEFIKKDEIIKEFDQIVAGKKKFDLRVWRWVNYLRWYTLILSGEKDD